MKLLKFFERGERCWYFAYGEHREAIYICRDPEDYAMPHNIELLDTGGQIWATDQEIDGVLEKS
jgi:hypothetical protein